MVAAAAVVYTQSDLDVDITDTDADQMMLHDAQSLSFDSAMASEDLPPTTLESSQIRGNSSTSLQQLFEKVQQSVVQITDSDESDILNSRLGSGFVYDNQGHIITNNHVIAGGGRIDVTLLDGTVYRAQLVGTDPYTDLAVLYVDAPKDKLAPLSLADSSKMMVGEQVAAIGNPFGLSGSMTTGIISGKDRLIPVQQSSESQNTMTGSFSIPGVIQTDAAINPGNSGGPLLNMASEVIGINSAIFSTTGQFAGIGFAIPSNTISRVIPVLIQNGSYSHPWLGVVGTNMTPDIAEAIGLDEPRGFLVASVVPGSPVDKAGLVGGDTQTRIGGREIALGGDVILEIDGKTLRKIDDMLVYLEGEKQVGDSINLTLFRNGKIVEVSVELAARPNSFEIT